MTTAGGGLVDIEHTATARTWGCTVCGEPWPCLPAQKELAATHSPTQLAMLMWMRLEEAAFDLPTMPVGQMFQRFLSWTWTAPVQPFGD